MPCIGEEPASGRIMQKIRGLFLRGSCDDGAAGLCRAGQGGGGVLQGGEVQGAKAAAPQLHEYVYVLGVLQVPSGLIARTVYPLLG